MWNNYKNEPEWVILDAESILPSKTSLSWLIFGYGLCFYVHKTSLTSLKLRFSSQPVETKREAELSG